MNILKLLNPFLKKSINISENRLNNYNRDYFLQSFGSNKVVFEKYIQSNQDDFKLIDKYNSLAEFSAPINKFANSSKMVVIDVFVGDQDKNVYAKDNDPIYMAITDFWQKNSKKLIIYYQLLGNAYINKLEFGTDALGKKLSFSLLPPQYTKIIPKKSTNIDIRDVVIDKYKVDIDLNHKQLYCDAKDILHLKNDSVNDFNQNYLYGFSSLVSNGHNTESIECGYGAKVGLYRNGPRGIVTGKQQGEFAAANASSGETVDAVQERFNEKYGMQENQWNWLFTDIPLDVTPISMNIQQLQINENNNSDYEKICASLDIDPRCVGMSANNTFDNVKAANDFFFNGSFKSLIDYIVNQFSTYLKTFYPNYFLKPNYQNIPAIVDAQRSYNKELLEQVEKGLITRNEYYQYTNQRTVKNPEFDEHYTLYQGIWRPLNYVVPINQQYINQNANTQTNIE